LPSRPPGLGRGAAWGAKFAATALSLVERAHALQKKDVVIAEELRSRGDASAKRLWWGCLRKKDDAGNPRSVPRWMRTTQSKKIYPILKKGKHE